MFGALAKLDEAEAKLDLARRILWCYVSIVDTMGRPAADFAALGDVMDVYEALAAMDASWQRAWTNIIGVVDREREWVAREQPAATTYAARLEELSRILASVVSAQPLLPIDPKALAELNAAVHALKGIAVGLGDEAARMVGTEPAAKPPRLN